MRTSRAAQSRLRQCSHTLALERESQSTGPSSNDPHPSLPLAHSPAHVPLQRGGRRGQDLKHLATRLGGLDGIGKDAGHQERHGEGGDGGAHHQRLLLL